MKLVLQESVVFAAERIQSRFAYKLKSSHV
jgi:hypothetical protein